MNVYNLFHRIITSYIEICGSKWEISLCVTRVSEKTSLRPTVYISCTRRIPSVTLHFSLFSSACVRCCMNEWKMFFLGLYVRFFVDLCYSLRSGHMRTHVIKRKQCADEFILTVCEYSHSKYHFWVSHQLCFILKPWFIFFLRVFFSSSFGYIWWDEVDGRCRILI